MFFRINEKNIVNLEDISYVSVEQNQMGMFELRIFLKQVEHYMFVNFVLEEDAMMVFENLAKKLELK
jgi:hypothetical protein